jgi:hypothetical protein
VVRTFQVRDPDADGEVIMQEFAFTHQPIRAGQMTVKVVNAGDQPHEMLLGKLAPGVRLAEVLAFESDPIEAGLLLELSGGLRSGVPVSAAPRRSASRARRAASS